MSESLDLTAQKPYALDRLAQLQKKLMELSQSMVIRRARIEKYRQSDLAAARDTYTELERTRGTLVGALSEVQLFLLEMDEYCRGLPRSAVLALLDMPKQCLSPITVSANIHLE